MGPRRTYLLENTSVDIGGSHLRRTRHPLSTTHKVIKGRGWGPDFMTTADPRRLGPAVWTGPSLTRALGCQARGLNGGSDRKRDRYAAARFAIFANRGVAADQQLDRRLSHRDCPAVRNRLMAKPRASAAKATPIEAFA